MQWVENSEAKTVKIQHIMFQETYVALFKDFSLNLPEWAKEEGDKHQSG